MNQWGEFSTHTRDGEYVTKELNRRHPAGERFIAAGDISRAEMNSYLAALRSAGVWLPRELHVITTRSLIVRHRWVHGPNLLDAAQTAPDAFSVAVSRIGGWVRDLDGADARIDTNLANFCHTANGPVLVDVLPPLIPSLRPDPENLFDELFNGLCFDTPIILDALLGYALRTLLRTAGQVGARRLLPVVDELIDDTSSNGFPARWFRARLRLAIQAACEQVIPARVQEFFALTSVLRFRQLDEPGRRLRMDQTARRIREWNL